MNRQWRRSAWVQTELGSERHQRLLADRLDQRGRADVDPRADAVVCWNCDRADSCGARVRLRQAANGGCAAPPPSAHPGGSYGLESPSRHRWISWFLTGRRWSRTADELREGWR